MVLSGLNAPLVSGRSAPGKPKDYDTLYVPWGSADIFFPTDFDALGRFYRAAATGHAGLREHGDGAIGGGGGSQRADGASKADGRRSQDAAAAVASEGGGREKGAAAGTKSSSSSSGGTRRSSSSSVTCRHLGTGEFMAGFVGSKVTCTLSGYNPLLQDWQNTRMFEGHSNLKKFT